MRILQLCHKPPVPAVDGGCIAMKAASKAIVSAGAEIQVLAIETAKHPFEPAKDDLPFTEQTKIKTVFVDTAVKPLDAFLNIFSSKSYNIDRFYHSCFEEELIKTLKENVFDVIQLESLFVAPYISAIRKYSPHSKIILRAHNLEHVIWKRATSSGAFPKNVYLKLLASRLEKYEKDTFQLVDGIIAISMEDKTEIEKWARKTPVCVIPINIEIENAEKPLPGLFFLGSFDWHPNLSGIQWFIDKAWPQVLKAAPGAKLSIAGRKMSRFLDSRAVRNIDFIGEVDDAKGFMQKHGIMVVPLFSGSGVRVKILEAMALGKTVISTAIGAEGIGCEAGKEILIADTESEFAETIAKCLSNPAFCEEIGRNAITFVKNNFSTQKIGEAFCHFYREVVVQQ
jgi:polysaccharide biosynthesis protein PslH